MNGYPTKEEALHDFFKAWRPTVSSELVNLDKAVGRITAQDIYSKVTLPVVRASACDGIAIRSSDFENGMPDTSSWQQGVDYVRADTGDDFDDAFDAVIAIEKVTIHDDGSLSLANNVVVEPNYCVRLAGSTICKNDFIMGKGLPIRATDLAAIALGGHATVQVRRRPVVAFIATGSELVPAGIEPNRGQNIDTNSLLIEQILTEYGAEPLVFPLVHDDREALTEAFKAALKTADMVVINGGSSKGEEDYNTHLITKIGKVIHHYIAAVPGRPTMLAVADEKPIVILPGPPMAAYFGAQWCLQPSIARFLQIPAHIPLTIKARATESCGAPPQMAMIQHLDVRIGGDGRYEATPVLFKQNTLGALVANAQRVSEIGESGFEEGDIIDVEILRGIEYL